MSGMLVASKVGAFFLPLNSSHIRKASVHVLTERAWSMSQALHAPQAPTLPAPAAPRRVDPTPSLLNPQKSIKGDNVM